MDSGSLQSSSSLEGECDSRSTVHDSALFNRHIYQQNHINNVNPFLFSASQLPNLDPIVPSSLVTTPTTALTNPPRNPKKRSRASRRAPTTVLTTDTSNFRAMVQEFTGVPTPTITTTFDVFGRSNINNFDNLPQQPSCLQKLPSSSSSFLDSMQNPITFPFNSLNQSPLLNPKATENLVFSNRFGAMQQTHSEEHCTTLQDLVTIPQFSQSTPKK